MQRKQTFNFWGFLNRLLLLGVLTAGGYYLATQSWAYLQVRHHFPVGTTIAGVNVAGLSQEEAFNLLVDSFSRPVYVQYREEVVEINPLDVGFEMNVEAMVKEALSQQTTQPEWERFTGFLLQQPIDTPITVSLKASHDPAAVQEMVEMVADLLDKPAVAPQLLSDTGVVQKGSAGYVMEVESTVTAVTQALYNPTQRTIAAVVLDQPAPELTFDYLKEHILNQLEYFDGVGTIYVLNLQTGEEISINGDAAISGLSVVKVAIMIEMFRAVNGPLDFDQVKLLDETAIYSGNYSANLLLDIVAGQDNAYLGVDVLTESMHRLGLVNTFIVTPYEEKPRPGKTTYITPANSRTDINLDPDPAMQTTAEEMGSLLAMIYYCSKGGGTLLAVYPEEITPDECQLLLDRMVLNTEGNLIRFGVPEDVPVAHKHGWAYNTHGDVGIVFSPGGDYVIAQYVHQDSDWLNAGVSFPLLREISRSVYNFFNVDNPYVDHKRAQKAAGKFAIEKVLEILAVPPDAEP